jgi:hypothetical protein
MVLNVIEVWYGRYPNTEVAMQALLFAALLAMARVTRMAIDFSDGLPARCSCC